MIEKPMFFEEAIRFLLEKDPNPAEWDSSEWAMERPSVRVKSFFSAKVENARFLDRAQGFLFDFMAGTTEKVISPEGVESIALRAGGRAEFIRSMRAFMVKEGMAAPEEFAAVNQNDLKDIRSVARLNLIFDTNVRSAYGYGNWMQGMKPAVRYRFPAARFIRTRGVMIPRLRHANSEGMVRLKTDRAWWAGYQNDPLIGGFGVPWPPYGFNSGMDQQDVSREEAKRLGLKVDRHPVEQVEDLPGLADTNTASVKKMDPAIKAKLLAEIDAKIAEAKRGKKSPGDYAAERIAQMRAREEGDRIILESLGVKDIVPVLPDEPSPDIERKDQVLPPKGKDRSLVDAANDFRRVLQPGAEGHGEEGYIDRSEQFQRIEAEAKRLGFLYDRLEPELVGGMEHDLIFDGASGTVLKLTKPSSAAYIVDFYGDRPSLSNGDPLEYLERLALHSEVFGDFTDFVGIGGLPNNRRIVTRQPTARGREARWDEIIRFMVDDLGFTKLRHNHGIGYEDSYAFVRDDIAVFDLRPANVIITTDDVPFSFDSIPVRVTASQREYLLR